MRARGISFGWAALIGLPTPMLRVKSMIRGLFRLLPMLLLAVACSDNVGVQLPDVPGGEESGEHEEVYDKFYKGTTISFANYVMDLGLVYRENGEVADPYKSIKAHGANIVRLQLDRVAFPEYEGVTIDWQQWDRVVRDAKCALSEQLDIMLTLKPDYDIFTATDASHNNLPEDWASLDEYNIGLQLYEWVYSSLEALYDEGVVPAIVAVGNEVNLGFMQSGSYDAARSARLLVKGYDAVRKFSEDNDVKIITALHIADPSKVGILDTYKSNGFSGYDVVALSWYPGKNIGHSLGSYNSFESLGKDMLKRYNKRIMVLETAHSFTTGSVDGKWMGDWCDNSYNYPDWDDAKNAQNYTPRRQREWLRALAEDVKAGGGIGLITWGTESLPDLLEGKAQGHGLGLYTYPAAWGYGSTWENNSYWDFTDGNNLHEGIDWMLDVE